MRYQQVWL